VGTTVALIVAAIFVLNIVGGRVGERNARIEQERWERMESLEKRYPSMPWKDPTDRIPPLDLNLPALPLDRDYVDHSDYRGQVQTVAIQKRN
jgi:hypothetical protein